MKDNGGNEVKKYAVTILQINDDRDPERTKFNGTTSPWKALRSARFQGNEYWVADLRMYDELYKLQCPGTLGNMPVQREAAHSFLLEKMFNTFNQERPTDFLGHSLSVSDLVEIDGAYYFCDSFGWVEVAVTGDPITYDSHECRLLRLKRISGLLRRAAPGEWWVADAETLRDELTALCELPF